MSIEPYLGFYNSQVLGQPGSVEKIINLLQQDGLTLFNFTVGSSQGPFAHWETRTQKTDIEKAYQKGNLSFTARNNIAEFELHLHLDWNLDLGDGSKYAHIGAMTYQTSYFHSDENAAVDYSRLFLDFGKLLYLSIQPDFGWIDIDEPAGSTWFDDVKRLAIPYVYWANFFGRGYCEKYGKENLLRAPAWHTETLSDGGCLIVLSPILGRNEQAEEMKKYMDRLIRRAKNDSK